MARTKSARNFHIVLNQACLEYYTDIIGYLKSLSGFQYLLVTEHVGQPNKHYHVYVQYNQSKQLSIPRLFGGHIEKCFSSAKRNIDYLMCRDKKHQEEGVTAILIEEEGEPKLKGGNYTVGYLRDVDNVDEIPAVFYNIKRKIDAEESSTKKFHAMLDELRNDSLSPVKVIYFIGKPGKGKTYNAYKYAFRLGYANEDITKVTINNNFFEFTGSINDKCLIVEEFRPSQLHPSSLLQFTDKYGYSCPIKGSHKYVKPEVIIICSIIHPAKLYSEQKEELNEQFTRRISHLFEVTNNHSYFEVSLDHEFYYTHNVINRSYSIENASGSRTIVDLTN